MSMALTNNDNPLEQSQGNYTHFVPIKDENPESLGKNMLENPSIKKKSSNCTCSLSLKFSACRAWSAQPAVAGMQWTFLNRGPLNA